MKKNILFMSIFLIFLASQVGAQTPARKPNNDNHYPWVPRVTAFEAYTKYKNGKALILHAGGNNFKNRHIVGAINVDFKPREKYLQKFPKKGIEIFLYCY